MKLEPTVWRPIDTYGDRCFSMPVIKFYIFPECNMNFTCIVVSRVWFFCFVTGCLDSFLIVVPTETESA